MFSWSKKDKYPKQQEIYDTVVEGLKNIYKNKLLPLEEQYLFHEFHSPQLQDSDFDAKPMILLVGQYSTGKTTFIKHLLEREYPGMRIGPEPTTDSFMVVTYDHKEGIIPGNALVADHKRPFRPLAKFGNAFLNRFQCSLVDSPVLKNLTIIDTPGILSGEKQRVDRGYDFTGVLEWFAERVDRIILLFDAHKLDISDEFKRCIEALRGHDDKIRIILNKADMIDYPQLLRVYGALMWYLGKVLEAPEVARVYVGSFWDQPMHYDVNSTIFEQDEEELFKDLQSLPRNAVLRKFNDFIKRARLAKVHALMISRLRKKMPSYFGKKHKRMKLIENLGSILNDLKRDYQISPGDFPDIKKMQNILLDKDFNKFQPLKSRLFEVVDKMLTDDISSIMAKLPLEDPSNLKEDINGGVFLNFQDPVSPFGNTNGFRSGESGIDWIVNQEKSKYNDLFEKLANADGKVTGSAAKSEMVKSKLQNTLLNKIWNLADIDRDGMLDEEEFALCMYLLNVKINGNDLPNTLTNDLVPPSKRRIYFSSKT